MPNTLPVPSKAALRTLRNIAFGTSCTLAFTTALLTEDRRRRIHAAREVHNNAKKLKSSRKYHSGGTLLAESFEDLVIRYSDDEFWLAKASLNIHSPQVATPPVPPIPVLTDPCPRPSHFKISNYQHLRQPDISRIQQLEPLKTPPPKVPLSEPRLPERLAPPRGPKLRKIVYKPEESIKASSLHRQRSLAVDVSNILENKQEPSDLDAALLRFFEAFEEGLLVEDAGLARELTYAAAKLSKACQLEGKFDVSEKIVNVLAAYGPFDEDVFHSLGVEGIVRDFMIGLEDRSARYIELQRLKLGKAVALYLTKFKEKPGTSSKAWQNLGEILCATTHRYELFDLTERMYWRLEKCRGDAPNCCVHFFMEALHKQERHKEVVKFFRRLNANIRSDQLSFYNMGDIVVDSALKLQRLDMAEEALITLAKLSEDNQRQCSTTWFLKVLRADWMTHSDIRRTRALFDRLEPHFHIVAHPRAAYGAMIQFCVEAGDEDAARWYYDYRLEKATPGSATQQDLRVQGHFAYAKALRGDWVGVREDFRNMRLLSPDKFEFSASFTPIFKLFAKSHQINETEEFIRSFIYQGYVVLTPYMSTTMINKYAAAREVDSISRWLDYMISVQSPADAMFFNAIIHNCRTKWDFSFEETYGLYVKVRKMGGPAAKFVNEATISILRGSAMASAGRNVASAVKNLNRLKLDQPLKAPVGSESVQQHMAVALATGNPVRALRIYDRAQKSVLPLDSACISTAVQAALQVSPKDVFAAISLLRKPQQVGRDISAAVATIFVHQISYRCTNLPKGSTQVQNVAWNTIRVLETQGVKVSTSLLTHTMHNLVSQRQYYQAVDFWKSMAASQRMPQSPDLPTLTVLLRAYIGARDCAGIDWTIQTLSVNGLLPDQIFQRPLKSALNIMRNALESKESGYFDCQFYEVIKNALRIVSAIRFEATKDREYVKSMTMKIIERAIEMEKKSEPNEVVERISKNSFKAQPADEEKSLSSLSGGSLGIANWQPIQQADLHLSPVGRLVGVHDG